MQTLLFRIAGPMQSWGSRSRFTERDTGLEPTKSGIIGIACASLGRPRDAPVDDLARLRMGVRVDREGIPTRDFQTAHGARRADDSGYEDVLSSRYFLADGLFLVGLEGEDEAFLRQIDAALASPAWQLFLGRKSYVPSLPIRIYKRPPGLDGLDDSPGIINLALEDALERFPLLDGGTEARKCRFIIEQRDATEVQQDQPGNYDTREHGTRRVHTTFGILPKGVAWLEMKA